MHLPFKKPRPNKPHDVFESVHTLAGIRVLSEREADEVARHGEVLRWSGSESEEDTQVVSTVHRKDNSAWGKRMEKELAAIEKRAAEKTKLGNSEDSKEN
jgi:hypothetical protein